MEHFFEGGQWVVALEDIIQHSRHSEDEDLLLANKGESLRVGYCTKSYIEVSPRRNRLLTFEVKPHQIELTDPN